MEINERYLKIIEGRNHFYLNKEEKKEGNHELQKYFWEKFLEGISDSSITLKYHGIDSFLNSCDCNKDSLENSTGNIYKVNSYN